MPGTQVGSAPAGGGDAATVRQGAPPHTIPAWRSLRTRIAAGVALVALGVSLVVGAAVDHAAALDGRERLRTQAVDRLESGITFYESRGRGRFGVVVNDPTLPPDVRDQAVEGRRVTYFDGTTMYAAQRIGPEEVLSAALPGDDLRAERTELRWALARAAALAAGVATLLGWLVGTWLSRRLRAGAQAATRIAAGETGVRAAQPGSDEVALLTSELDRMADQLQRRLELERQFTADVAHELRSPVTGLVSAAELLPDDELGRLLRGQVTRLRRLVEDLLEISRLDAGAVDIDWQDCDLGDVVRRAVEPVADQVEVEVDRAGVSRAEPRRVERIVSNLVRNALTYGAAPVRVTVDGATVTVVDCGAGFPAELLADGPRRFATFTGGGTGSGLGLTIATKHADAMGGRLVLSNLEHPDSGAVAEVHLRHANPADADAPD